MSLCTYSLLRRISRINGRRFSTAAKVQDVQEEPIESFRTTECDPTNHDTSHLNRFYTIPRKVTETLYFDKVPIKFKDQAQAFAEFAILIRKPAIEIISYLEQTDYTKPVNRYVLYGINGTGKTITLLHLLHYAFMKRFILINVPWANAWFRFPKEVAPSPLTPGETDLPVDAGKWLIYFKHQNGSLLKELNLTISKDYEWNQREVTKSGMTILELVEFGISRMRYACGVINALVDELKEASTAGKCRTLVAIDGYNAFTSDYTSIRDDKRELVPPKKITLTTAFMKCTEFNWCNGAVVLTVDQRAAKDRRESHFPGYILGKEGFEHLDPFLPVAVENYTADEFETVMEYYKNRKWVRDITPQGQRELELLSNRNPATLMDCCKAL